MTKYFISFPSSAMRHIPDADWPAVGEDSHAVVRAAKIAVAYRCPQEVREFGYDPES